MSSLSIIYVSCLSEIQWLPSDQSGPGELVPDTQLNKAARFLRDGGYVVGKNPNFQDKAYGVHRGSASNTQQYEVET